MAVTPATAPLLLRRNQPYVEEFEFFDEAGEPFDFTGYTAELQVRLYGAAAGSSLITLHTVADDSQGVRLMDAFTWRVHITEASINSLPPAAEAGGTAEFVFDWRFDDGTPLGRAVWLEGTTPVKPGVTK